jgi:uncharacterized protein YjiS (DUF1127 family)
VPAKAHIPRRNAGAERRRQGGERRSREPEGDTTMAARAITTKDINALSGRTYPARGTGDPARTLLRRLATWYQENRRYRGTVAELASLSDHVLADIGIGRHEIEDVARRTSRVAL